MMSIENPWFTTRFSADDYATVARLTHAGARYRAPNFEPIRLSSGGTYRDPTQIQRFGNSAVHEGVKVNCIEFRTARYEFLERVYAQALAATEQRFPGLYDVHWVPCLPNWREVVLPECHSDAAEFLEEQIRLIAGSGGIHVQTGVRLFRREAPADSTGPDPYGTCLRVIADDEHVSGELTKRIIDRGRTGERIDMPVERRTFSASDITEFVVRPTPQQIELLNHWDATPPAAEADKAMIAAAEDLDIDAVERLVGAGANVDALGRDDDTALTTAIRAMGHKTEDFDAVEGGADVIQRFLALGADVDLFGYDGVDPLIAATLAAAPAVVEALLGAGADPNHNAWPEDDLEALSSALYYASGDAVVYGGTARGDACDVIERLLDDAGAVMSRPE